jgi:hypothetical protein
LIHITYERGFSNIADVYPVTTTPLPSTIGTISPLHLPQKIKEVAAVLKKQQVELPFNETVTKWGEKVKPTD